MEFSQNIEKMGGGDFRQKDKEYANLQKNSLTIFSLDRDISSPNMSICSMHPYFKTPAAPPATK